MKKKELENWAWYPLKRFSEGKGILGSTIKRIEDWELLERIGKPESRKIMPLATFRRFIYGQEERGEEKEKDISANISANEDSVSIPFDGLPTPVKNYAKKEAEKTGVSLNEVVKSEAFRKYLFSRFK